MLLILGADSLRADRALQGALKDRGVDVAEITRIWGDEASFAEVFEAATSRTLFSSRTIVVVRRAERLRGAGGLDPDALDDDDQGSEDRGEPEPAEEREKAQGKRATRSPPVSDLPELDPSSCLIFVARKVDRRVGLWKKLSKTAEVVDVDYFKNKALYLAAAAEARTMGLRVPEEVVRETVDQSGPSLGRIVSEFEKMILFQSASGKGMEDIVAVTSSQPLYRLSDAISAKDKRLGLELLGEALQQGEAGLRILATAHGTVRKLALLRALRRAGVPSAEAGAQAGILPFRVADTERAARAWSDAELARSFALFAEADRRLKLSAPAGPLLAHTLAIAASGALA